MPRAPGPKCQVCNHPDRARIELARIGGVSLDAIAAQFGVGRDVIWRHCARHMTDAERAAYLSDVPISEMVARAADEGVGLLDYFKIVRATLIKQFQMAAAGNDRRAVAALAGKLNEILNSIGGLTGELLRLAPGNVTNNFAIFVNSPEFAGLQAMLVRRLARHPQALGDVLQGLEELEAQSTSTPFPTIPVGRVINGETYAAPAA